jgi:hypothetical protein
MNLRNLVLAVFIAAGSQQVLAQSSGAAPANAGASSTASTNPPREGSAKRDLIRSLPLDIKLGEFGISLPPSEPEPPEAGKADAKAPDSTPKADAPGAAEKRN